MTRAIKISRDLVGLGGGGVVRQSDGQSIDQTGCERTVIDHPGVGHVLKRPRNLAAALISEASQTGQING